jgi:UDP-N-acetylglucosamine:LPS N-acetylglucosamine transferase
MRMVVVTGPRIDPASLPAGPGVEVRGWLPDLHRLLAAGDVALVQGGLTTTMELTAAGRPFVYVPLRNHFEQNWHVRHRLEQYGAGVCVPWEEATPERLADELAGLVGTTPDVRPVETDGAARAAALLADLL